MPPCGFGSKPFGGFVLVILFPSIRRTSGGLGWRFADQLDRIAQLFRFHL